MGVGPDLARELIIPVYVLFIQLLWDEFPLTIIPMIWIMGIGFGLAVIYSIASNIVFLWRAWKRTPMSVKNKAPRYNFLLVGGIIQLIIGTILLAMVIVFYRLMGETCSEKPHIYPLVSLVLLILSAIVL